MSQTTMSLSGRVAIVTGASSGIGQATARLLARQGAKVAVLARREAVLSQLVAEIEQVGGRALAVAADVTDQASVDAAAAAVLAAFGPADLLFNNAGLMLPGAIDSDILADSVQQIDINVTGVMRVIHAFMPQLSQAAAAGGRVDLINTSSIAGQNIYPYFATYSATKAYVSHLSRHLRAELGGKGIRVAMIEPGIVSTELQSHWTFQGAEDWLAGAREQMDFLQPGDVAEVVAFLAALPKQVNLQQVVVMPTGQAS